ncbi:MAG: GtrA family protein [Oscillospiraceae bacterium]
MKKLISAFFDRQFLKFCLVGVANTLFGTAIMFGLYNLAGCSYWLSSAMNYVCGSVLSYFLNKYFTFKSVGGGWRELLRFAANISLCYVIAYSLAKPLVYTLLTGASVSVRDNVSMLVGMVIFTGLNYLGQRFFAFRQPENGGKNKKDA